MSIRKRPQWLLPLAGKRSSAYGVSIIPRSVGALGHTLQLPIEERYLMTLPELDDQTTVMMGGRAAEETVYDGVISTGAGDDLQRASELIRQMVMRFGMSEFKDPRFGFNLATEEYTDMISVGVLDPAT